LLTNYRLFTNGRLYTANRLCTVAAMGKFDPAPTVAAGLLRTARSVAGLTQHDLAERAGVTQQAISAYETGRRDPTVGTLKKLLAAAGLEMRIRLTPIDNHDESLRQFLDTLPPERQAELETERRERAQAARLRRVRGA
jgi:transcriptional regulator with XRE-family HTH domain